ncbi:MAG: GNAT family N-acetyltransferase [Clostridia bacterium]|nr:GNAT family N-acetyltransferase [Clostridia bacterium]
MEYRIIEGADRISVSEVERLLKMTYWADKRTPETIEKSMRNSACFGIRSGEDRKLIGFARVISDYATTWYLCDVIIDPEYQEQGLGKALVSHITAQFSWQRGLLLTRDAHGLYAHYGFASAGDRAMTRSPG